MVKRMCSFLTYQKSSKKELISLSVILTILIVLSWLAWSITSAWAQRKADNSTKATSTAPAKPTGSVGRKSNVIPGRITVLNIIREDYQGTALSYPSKLFIDPVKREIYITDSGHGRILVYTHDFYPLLSIDKTDGIEAPVGLAVDRNGYLFIAQSPGKKNPKPRISLFDPSLKWKRDIFFSGFKGAKDFRPKNIAISQAGTLYVAGNGYAGVVVLDKEGEFSHILSPTDRLGKGEEQKATICDVEIDINGRIYLLSEDMGRIYVYNNKEDVFFKFGKKGGSSGKLSRPRGLAVDSNNSKVYVIDYMRHTANVYSGKGRFLFEFGGKGWGKGWFQFPSDISVDISGNVLVADTFNNRVQVFGITGGGSSPKVEEVKERETKSDEPTLEKPKKYYALVTKMNLRERGTSKSKIIRLMKKGERFEIIGQERCSGLTTWYHIKEESGTTGWFCGIYRGKTKFVEEKPK